MSDIDVYPLSWPAQWPRNQYPEYSRFEATIAEARNGILRELDLLGASNIIISSNAQVLRNGDIASRQRRIEDTGVAVYFKLNGRDMCIPCDKWVYLQDNLRAIEKTINALRGLDRWGTHQIIEAAFAGFEALPAGSSWWEILGVDRNADKAIILSAYRTLVKANHPDTGGDPEAFHRIQRAYEEGVKL